MSSAQDIALLATVDAAHEGLSGPAVRRILEREYQLFANSEYVRLAHISVSHIYNLRRSRAYRSQRVVLHRTQTRQVGIAERRKPEPRGQPGDLRLAPGPLQSSGGRALSWNPLKQPAARAAYLAPSRQTKALLPPLASCTNAID